MRAACRRRPARQSKDNRPSAKPSMTPVALVSIVAAVVLSGAADPKQAADELRERLVSRGPFTATYEIAMPSRGRTMSVEITADLPRACCLISGGGEDEVRAYADARGRVLYVLGREKGRPTLFRTDATALVGAVNDVRSAFIKAGLGTERALPGVTDEAGETSDALRLFATLTLGPARDRSGRPYIRSGTGLAVGTVTTCGSWLLDVAAARGAGARPRWRFLCLPTTPSQRSVASTRTPTPARGATLTVTDEAYRLVSEDGSVLTISRKTGLPTAARTQSKPGEAVTLTLKHERRLKAFETPAWVTHPPARVQVKDLDLPARQRRTAAFTAWTFYVARSVKHLAAKADWKATLAKRREQMVQALAGQAAPLWQDRGAGVHRGFLAVLRGAHLEAQRRFHYVKEPDPAKARAIAHQYALEALNRRGAMVKSALDGAMEQFAQALPRDVTSDAKPAEAAVAAEVLTIVHHAARAAYVRQAADTIADQLTARLGGE